MIAYNVSLGRSVKLGQVSYAQSYPPGGLEWGQGWGLFAPTTPKVVLPRSPEAGGGVGYASEGIVLSRQDVEDITAVGGAPAQPAAAAQPVAQLPASESKFPMAAVGITVVALAAALIA